MQRAPSPVRTAIVSYLFLWMGGLLPWTAAAQDNFMARVEAGRSGAVIEFIEHEGGAFQRSITLNGSELICFSGSQSLKARVRRQSGVLGVSDDPEVQWIDPAATYVLGASTHEKLTASSQYDDPFLELQWGHAAVHAPDAWRDGRGEGVRIALIDDGIDANHPDLSAGLNAALSASFVPGEDWRVRPGFSYHHGTHIAGIVAAAENRSGSVGIAPKAELIAIKAAAESTGSGAFSWMLEAIVYAARQEADIVHIGLGAMLPRVRVTGLAAAEMQDMLEVVARFARERGVLLIAPAGDDRENMDACCLYLPGAAEPIITVAATSTEGWAFDPYTEPGIPAGYTNTGAQYVDIAAPGGDIRHPGDEACTIAGMKRPCWVFDLVFSTTAGGWAWAAGTSAASAHVAGVAALIKSAHPGATVDALESMLYEFARPAGDDPRIVNATGKGLASAMKPSGPATAATHHDHATLPLIDGAPSLSLSEHEAPRQFDLFQNYPNPFNPQTTINFHLPYRTYVSIAVYDMTGRQIATLVEQELGAGCYDAFWNGRDRDGRTVQSGVYMYKIDAGTFVDARVMTFANN